MHKIFDNMLTDELKRFSWGRKRRKEFQEEGRKNKEGMAYAKHYDVPYYMKHPTTEARARVNESAEHSSTRINNVVLCLELFQSVLLSHLERTS